MRRIAAALALLLLAACTGDDLVDPGEFSLTGRWAGTAAPYEFTLDLTQTGEDVGGTGQVRVAAPAQTLDVSVEGDWDYPRVTLVLSAPGFADLTYAASFADTDSIAGTLNGSGFSSRQLSIKRVPVTTGAP